MERNCFILIIALLNICYLITILYLWLNLMIKFVCCTPVRERSLMKKGGFLVLTKENLFIFLLYSRKDYGRGANAREGVKCKILINVIYIVNRVIRRS